jgi:formyltetrahydrofolate deformylase
MSPAAPTSVLTVRCADRPGIAAAVSAAVLDADGNIANADQHTDRASGTFLQRVEIDDGCEWDKLAHLLDGAAVATGLIWRLHHPGPPKRIVLACSAQLHCAAEMLTRACLGELDVVIEAMVSDRGAGADLARRYDVPFHELAVGSDRVAQERALARLLDDYGADLVVLARYMRILPAALTDGWWGRMINIHHSFLPAFVGARPYSQAHERGVKLIGATAHYVTPELDAGPIIAQDIVRVSHRDEVVDLVRKGRDVERVVLAEAVRLHLEHRVLMFGNRTCVFD